MKSLVVLLTVAVMMFQGQGEAEEGLILGKFSGDYPGIYKAMEVPTVMDIGQSNVKTGVYYFFKVYQRLPESWQEVSESGIWQTPIRGFQMELINPDDPHLDFLGDLFLDAGSSDGTSMLLHELEYRGGNQVIKEPVGGDFTYERQFRIYEGSPAVVLADGSSMLDYLDDEDQLKQFAIIGCLGVNLSSYMAIHGDFPETLDQLFEAGLSNVNRNSLNPVTGERFKFDGSIGDIEYEYLGQGKMMLRHVDANGVAITY